MENIKKRNCKVCYKKLGISSGIICRCGNLYCHNHRYATDHNCTFDIHCIKSTFENYDSIIVEKIVKI